MEEISVCQGELRDNNHQCLPAIANGLFEDSCQVTPVVLQQPIVEQIDQHHVLLLTHQMVDLKSSCSTDQIQRISEPVAITIPSGCSIKIFNKTYRPDASLLNGSILLLPAILQFPNQQKRHPLILKDIKLNDIQKLHVHPVSIEEELPEDFPYSLMFYVILGALLCLTVIILIYRYRRRARMFIPWLPTVPQPQAKQSTSNVGSHPIPDDFTTSPSPF